MHEELLARIRALESAVRRWRMVSLSLFLFLLCGTIVGGVVGIIAALHQHRLEHQRFMLQADLEAQAEEAVARAEEARHLEQEALRRAKEAEWKAKQVDD
jgi:hypothetical protein